MNRATFTPAEGEWPGAGEWKPAALGNGDRTALVGCPACGQVGSLSQHDIGPDGEVNPSLVCPADGCDFHEHIELEGWDDGSGG